MRKLFFTCIAISTLTGVSAQTLFTYGNKPVTKEEFLKVYQKNSMNKAPDMSEQALKEYLNLYSLFKMKVSEAKILRLDTVQSIQYELMNYRKQLAKNYLTDEAMSEKLVQEAYDRMKKDVRVAHILITSSQFAQSKDTLAPYKKIDSVYNAILKGADFAKTAEALSDDGDSRKRGGDIGYFTALQTVYPFENAAYNTPVGKISKPFRSQFGYHIVKVLDVRPAVGTASVAQIMVSVAKSKGEEAMNAAKLKVDSIQAELKKGVPFEELVKKYSEDKFSKDNNGVLRSFGVGEMTPEFEKAAFSLKKPGDISAPVTTDYGIHIIKLINKEGLKPLDSLHASIKKKIENDSRSATAKEAYMNKIKQQNGFKEFSANYDELQQRVNKIADTGKQANMFTYNDFKDLSKPLFVFSGKEFLQNDLMKFMETLTRGKIMGARNAILKDVYNLYLNNIITDYQERKLVEEKPEFKALMEEYTDGIMLFELMDRNVWSKASKDTTGLKEFYETRKGKYQWDPGFTGAVYTFKNEAALKEGQKMLQAKKPATDEELMKKLNNEQTPDAVTVAHGRYEFSKYKDLPQASIAKGKLSEVKKNDNGTFTVVKADDVYTTQTPKSLNEAKGYVVAEYQDYLEKKWNDEMRAKYPVKLDDAVFKSMVK